MPSFLGEYEHTIDSKNRLSIPVRLRRGIERFYLSVGLDGCLYLYTPESWEIWVEQLGKLRDTKARSRFFKREMARYTQEVTVDSHGRIIVPPALKNTAGIDRDVLVIGNFDRIEIWDPEKNKEYREGFGLTREEVAEALFDDSTVSSTGVEKG